MANTLSGRFFPLQTVHLGVASGFATFNSATLPFDIPQAAGSSSTFGIGGGLGAVVEDSGKVWRLVQFDNGVGNVAAAAGHVAYWKNRASAIVTSDESDGEGLLQGFAGVFQVAVTDQYYCFVQIGGYVTNFLTDGSVAKGGALILTTSDGAITSQAAGSVNTVAFGYADADDAATVGTGWLYLGMHL